MSMSMKAPQQPDIWFITPTVEIPQRLIARRLLVELSKDLFLNDSKQAAFYLDLKSSLVRHCVDDGCARH
jgi:hypothetical protein